MDEILKNVMEAYEHLETMQRTGGSLAYGALKELSDQLGFKPSKVKKLLITAGLLFGKELYATDTGKLVLKLYKDGKTVDEIMRLTGHKRSSIFGYLPYTKTIYKAAELSTDAERIRLFRQRQKHCATFMDNLLLKNNEEAEEYLWFTLEFLQGCIFYKHRKDHIKGERFRYEIRGGDMIITNMNISISKTTIMKAFRNALKGAGNNRYVTLLRYVNTLEADYLYSIFLRLGLCVPEEIQ